MQQQKRPNKIRQINYPATLISHTVSPILGPAYFHRGGHLAPVLIYQMGKVGSSSIYRSLDQQYKGWSGHAHNLRGRDEPIKAGMLLHRIRSGKSPLNVISLTREPISRNISAFFQNFDRYTGCAGKNMHTKDWPKAFLERYPHKSALAWFDLEIHGRLGIDVYAEPFPKDGIGLYSKKNIRLLVLRCELPDEVKGAAISNFLGISGFQITNINIGGEKEYSERYAAFKKELVLPAKYIQQMCSSKYFRHFYPDAFIREVRATWESQLEKAQIGALETRHAATSSAPASFALRKRRVRCK